MSSSIPNGTQSDRLGADGELPANALAHDHVVGSYDDSATVEEFEKRCGVLTVEIEHVDVDTLEKLERQGVDCQPKASTIRIIQVGLSIL